MNVSITLVLVLLAVCWPLPASAGPILATLEHACVPFVPNAEVFWWSDAPFPFYSFRSDEAGCAATIEEPVKFFEQLDDFDGLGGQAYRVSSEMIVPPCGRVQWDAGELTGPVSWLIVDLGRDCEPPVLLLPPTLALPPEVSLVPPLVTPITPTPETLPIPEPGTVSLIGGGLALLVRRWRRKVV